MATKSFLVSDTAALKPVMLSCYRMVEKGLAAGPVVVTLGREKRNLDQNALLWVLLSDISEQLPWHGENLSSEDYKVLLTAGIRKQRAIPGIEDGFVVLGTPTSTMDKSIFSELLDFIYFFGSENNIKWSEKSTEAYNDYKEARV